MLQLKLRYQDILFLEKACFFYSELDVDFFSDKHSYMFKQSIVKHLYNKRIKRLADNPPKSISGKRPRDKQLNLEYFEATMLTEVLEKYTFGHASDMAYEIEFNRSLLLLIQDRQMANTETGMR